jgi:hypothetical protein
MAEVVPWDDMGKIFYKQMSEKEGRGSVDL